MTDQKKDQENYYGQGILGSYLIEAKGLVPFYDDMINEGISLLSLSSERPKRILDVGAGVGNVQRIMARRMPEAHIVCLEPSIDMLYELHKNIREIADMVSLLNQGVLDYNPSEPFDAVYSNSTLHNIDEEEKKQALKKIHEWLRPGGAFVWGDFIRPRRKELWEMFNEYRKKHGYECGDVSDLVIEQTFHKEITQDTPLTIEQSLQYLQDAEFEIPDLVWVHDTFALFYATKQESVKKE